MNRLHFCGGLPRTCSTVLMSILQQNPRIFTSSTSPLPEMLKDRLLIESRSQFNFMAMDSRQADAAMYGLIRGAAKGWYEGLTDKPVVISKNRYWSSLYHLFPESKYICLVRDLRDIFESVEKLNETNLALHSYYPGNVLHASMTEEEKIDTLFAKNLYFDKIINDCVKRLIEVDKKSNRKIFFLRTEDFLVNPLTKLKDLYRYLGEKHYFHNLDNIEDPKVIEHDNVYFTDRTSHKIKPQFQYYKNPNRKMSLKAQEKLISNYYWFYETFYPEAINNL